MSGYQQQYPQQPHPAAPSGNPFTDQPVNPYAAPQQAGYYPQQMAPKPSPYAGLWREGRILVMHKLAPLPDICLKSNEPATQRLKRNLRWHHPAVFLALLLNLIIYAVLAMIMSKQATIYIALTDEWFAIRRRRMVLAWCLVLLSMGLFGGSLALVEQTEWWPIGLIASVFLFFGAAVYGLIACRMVSPKRITDEYIWLKGVHPDFLNRLEPWPYRI